MSMARRCADGVEHCRAVAVENDLSRLPAADLSHLTLAFDCGRSHQQLDASSRTAAATSSGGTPLAVACHACEIVGLIYDQRVQGKKCG
jgi:hypothetical protein